MRVFILAAGDATRWGNYMGVPKHLVQVNGEPLLHRTVRLIREITPDAEVFTVVKRSTPLYEVQGATQVRARLHPYLRDADKFASSTHLWSKTSRNVLLYGDCYITTAAMRLILSDEDHEDGWHAFARFGASSFTGTPYGENLAHVVDPEAITAYRQSLTEIPKKTRAAGWVNGRCGGWEQYMNLTTGDPCQMSYNAGHATHIDDWSDGFDFPHDYDTWMRHYQEASPENKELAR